MNIPPTFPKPTYPDAFDWVAGLPPEAKANMCSLILRIWRHTNSDKTCENYGKAWMSHQRIAAEMHVGLRTVQDLFDAAWDSELISREHLFKKNGKTFILVEPYTKAVSHGLGEYLGSRYWVNWRVIKQLQTDGVARTATPNSSNGVAEIATPKAKIGVAKIATPIAEIATPVAKTATKVLIKGLNEVPTNHPPTPGLDGRTGGCKNSITPESPSAPSGKENPDAALSENMFRVLQAVHKKLYRESEHLHEVAELFPHSLRKSGLDKLMGNLRKYDNFDGGVESNLMTVAAAYSIWFRERLEPSWLDWLDTSNKKVAPPIKVPLSVFAKEVCDQLDDAVDRYHQHQGTSHDGEVCFWCNLNAYDNPLFKEEAK